MIWKYDNTPNPTGIPCLACLLIATFLTFGTPAGYCLIAGVVFIVLALIAVAEDYHFNLIGFLFAAAMVLFVIGAFCVSLPTGLLLLAALLLN